jgi:hypothetical protein
MVSGYNYVSYNPDIGRLLIAASNTGGSVYRGVDVEVLALAGTQGLRAGGLYVGMTRVAGQDFATGWDGNSDIALKVLGQNYAANAASRGSIRGIEVQARNRGTNICDVNAASLNARCDSGKTAVDLYGVLVRIESYGTISTEAIGLDVNMSIEGACTLATAVRIRNTDGSGMAAVRDVFRVDHTSTNGFTNLFYFGATSGDTVVVGTALTGSGGASVLNDAYIVVSIAGTPYYIPLFDTHA